MSSPVPVVKLFTRTGCELCQAVQYVINRVAADIPFRFELIDIDSGPHLHWREQYLYDIPVIHINDQEHARHRLNERAFRDALRDAPSPERTSQPTDPV